jgi:hypothetical protein
MEISAEQLPISLIEVPGVRACAHCIEFLCLWRRTGAHGKIEPWVEHRSWMAVAQWVDATTTNQLMMSALGGGWRGDIDGWKACRETFIRCSLGDVMRDEKN